MKYLIIDGGDNGYCCASNALADRNVILVDTDKKTLKYVYGGGVCLCKRCFRPFHLDLGDGKDWVLTRDLVFNRYSTNYKYYAYNSDGEQMKVIVKNNKWGKDGEYGDKFDMCYGATYDKDDKEIELVRFRKDKEKEHWAALSDDRKPNDYYFEKTGWKLVR